jgi:hypothetical protein
MELRSEQQPCEDQPMTDASARFIDVEGVRNFRDGGGYETSDGNRVRDQLGVRSVFDLRFPNEV